jgi:hypothetical protein
MSVFSRRLAERRGRNIAEKAAPTTDSHPGTDPNALPHTRLASASVGGVAPGSGTDDDEFEHGSGPGATATGVSHPCNGCSDGTPCSSCAGNISRVSPAYQALSWGVQITRETFGSPSWQRVAMIANVIDLANLPRNEETAAIM